jgi:hypothetical protein
MPTPSDHAMLEEQQWREVLLSSEDADLLRNLNFDVAPSYGSTSPTGGRQEGLTLLIHGNT